MSASDIVVDVLSATGEDLGRTLFSTLRQTHIGGACRSLEVRYRGFGRLESSAGVGIVRYGNVRLEAGTYIFRLTGTSLCPKGENLQLVAD